MKGNQVSSFNSYMVRFKEKDTSEKVLLFLVSIPIWFDLKGCFLACFGGGNTEFQFLYGSI